MSEPLCSHSSSLSTVLIIDVIATLFVIISLAFCGWFFWRRYTLQREYRNKLGPIMHDCYWVHEQELKKLLQNLDELRKKFLFREVTQLQVFAYKYRIRRDQFRYNDANAAIHRQVAHAQHFFKRLHLEFSLEGVCPQHISVCLKEAVQELSAATVDLWSDANIQVLTSVERYFCGVNEASAKWMSDSELKSLVEPMIPYVDQIHLGAMGNYFVLDDMKVEAVTNPETISKIRCIDTVLSANDPSLSSKRKSLVDLYNTAREICLSHKFVTNQCHLPEIPPTEQPDPPVSIRDVVMYVLHLLRVLCVEQYLTEMHSDDCFLTLLFHLYHNVCGGIDPAVQNQVVERIKRNINTLLQNLTDQPGRDAESTRIRLENVERDLLRQLTPQDSKRRSRKNLLATHRNLAAKSFESEASVYTMALSASAFALQRQGTVESDLGNYHAQRFLTQHQSAEMMSAPSVYDTAPSHVSSANENTPLISNTPPTPLSSSSPDHIEGRHERPQSPMSVDSDYCETAV